MQHTRKVVTVRVGALLNPSICQSVPRLMRLRFTNRILCQINNDDANQCCWRERVLQIIVLRRLNYRS